jgi:hypothetical protein
MSSVPIRTEVFRRESVNGLDIITVMASIDGSGAEIRVIHERDGEVVADTIPHWGDDPTAGQRWVGRHRDTCLADGYRLVEEYGDSEN